MVLSEQKIINVKQKSVFSSHKNQLWLNLMLNVGHNKKSFWGFFIYSVTLNSSLDLP